ncbi:site-2 protease family protein [Patescibacteria group bacterium]|nr:site-2 protease family protein [Patescibacteria group bacterium]
MLISLLFTAPILFFAIFVALVVSITFHEFCHVLAARLQGDTTGERMGRLTLNPLAHLDLWGTLAILFIGFGWGRPAPYNPYNLKNQKYGSVLVALAGPASNLFLIIFFGLLLKVLYPIFGPMNYLTIFLAALVGFNGVLMVFNLIPIPPLDGSHLLHLIVDRRWPNVSRFVDIYGPQILLGLVFVSLLFNISIFGYIIDPILSLINRIFGIPGIF